MESTAPPRAVIAPPAPAGQALVRERYLILGLLLALAAAAWVVLLAWPRMDMPAGTDQMAGMAGMGGARAATGLTMGMGAPLFLALWVVMMVAMMFPTAAPMVLMFARVGAGRRARGSAFVPTWVFVAAYLLVWTAFGVVAFAGASLAQGVAQSSPWVVANAGRIGGVAIVLAGLYQLTPLKRVCLAKCRSPLSFLTQSWRDGYAGALRMGLDHGVYCLGCCWLLFVILFPLGMMNVAAMAVITLLIYAEKAFPIGPRVSQAAAALLVAYGLLVMVVPDALPLMAAVAGEQIGV